MPVMAPDLKAMSRPAARLLDAACAVRTLARTETCMPMKPAAPDSTAPIRKPIAAVMESSHQAEQQHDHADDGDGGVLARQIGLRAFADGGGDFLHACVALIGCKNRSCRPDGVKD
jgi:hypothetical protein